MNDALRGTTGMPDLLKTVQVLSESCHKTSGSGSGRQKVLLATWWDDLGAPLGQPWH